jgi:type IX secretion system PorP/SprF family membrane protein
MVAAVDMPFWFLGGRHGAGLKFINDQIGLFAHNSFSLFYAYQQNLFGGWLSGGAQFSMLSETFNGSKLQLEEASDPAFATSELKGSGFDLGFGLYYRHKHWYVGASVLHAFEPTVELGEVNEITIGRTYYFTAGGNIRTKYPFLTIHPSVLGRSDGVGYRADGTVRVDYTHDGKVLYGGVGYSPTNSFTVYLGGQFHGVMLGYSYEIYTNGQKLGNGGHELRVGYQTDMNIFKKGRNRHQSVRLL